MLLFKAKLEIMRIFVNRVGVWSASNIIPFCKKLTAWYDIWDDGVAGR